jgi:hypothetical protein
VVGHDASPMVSMRTVPPASSSTAAAASSSTPPRPSIVAASPVRRASRPTALSLSVGSPASPQTSPRLTQPNTPIDKLDATALALQTMPAAQTPPRLSFIGRGMSAAIVSSAGPSVAGSGPRPSAANEGKLVRKSTANRNTHNVSRWARRQSEDEYGAHAGARHGLGQDAAQAGPRRTLKDRLYFWRNCTFRVVLTTVNISLLVLVILCLALYTILRGEQYVAPQRECVRGRGEETERERETGS